MIWGVCYHKNFANNLLHILRPAEVFFTHDWMFEVKDAPVCVSSGKFKRIMEQ